MRRYACWEGREVRRTLVDDANRDAPAVLGAVHRPAHVLRKDIRREAADPGTAVGEHDVLEALLGGDPEEDRIVPIVGRSGSGKSHLIRWLDAHIERTENRHVVYIEKRGTSLRQVVHKILEALDRPGVRHQERFAKLRTEVDKARDMTAETARLRLLTELALTVREYGVETSTSDDERIDREDLAERLPDFLTDPEFRVPLLSDGGVIDRTVDKALGKGPDDGEAPAFENLDLQVRDVRRAGQTARDVYDDLRGDRSMKELALQMLNEQLNFAVGALIGVDRKQIYDVMLQVREALNDEGKTLILLVEDFALLRGLETQLLDAMIADAESFGERVLCPMRSALAVTSGYFEGKDTALTRIHSRGRYMYSLDTNLGEVSGVSQESVESFVATYMNAARVGLEDLKTAFESRDPNASGGAWVPNACDLCDYRGSCHAAFGEAEGYGLYPFNPASLERIVSSTLEYFDPRHILQIVERTLRGQRKKLTDGLFPDPAWAADFSSLRAVDGEVLPMLSAAAETAYEIADPDTVERRKVLITFWGGAPIPPVNLDDTIHEAFDLPPIAGLPVFRGGPLPFGDDPAAEQPEPAEDARGAVPATNPAGKEGGEGGNAGVTADPIVRALDRWGNNLVLEQREALAIRTALSDAVLGALDWAALGVSQRRLTEVVRPQAFSLGANAKGEASASAVIGTLEPSARNAFMLQGALAASRGVPWDDSRGLDQLADFAENVDAWANVALVRLRQQESPRTLAELLLLGGVVLGLAGSDDTAEQLVEGVFGVPSTTTDGAWGAFQRRVLSGASGSASRRGLVEALTVACGLHRASDGGLLIAVDVAPILEAIDGLHQSAWTVPSEEALRALPREVRLHAQMLRNDLADEVATRLRTLSEQRAKALRLVGDERDARVVIDAVANAYVSAGDIGIGGGSHAAERGAHEAQFGDADLKILDRLADLDRLEELSWPESLGVLVRANRENLSPVSEYLAWADAALAERMDKADTHLAGQEGDDSLTKTTAVLVAALTALAGDLQDLLP